MPEQRIDGFILERIAEELAIINLAAREGGTWWHNTHVSESVVIESIGGAVVYNEGAPDEYQAAHIARWNPNRSRQILEAMEAIVRSQRGPYVLCPPTAVLRSIAQLWADHASYKQEWKPVS